MKICSSPQGQRVIVGAVVMITVAGCGLRVSHDEVLAHYRTSSNAGPQGTTGASPGGDASTGAIPTTAPTLPGSGAGTGTGGLSTTTGSSGSSTGTTGTSTGSTGGGGAHETIVIGTTGGYTGLSSIGVAARDTLLVWAKFVNAQGGIGGHKVQVIAEDNASDDNRALAAVQDLVANKHAVAIVGTGPGADIASFMPYLQSKKVPLVGGFTQSLAWWQYTMAFPTGTYTTATTQGYDTVVARVANKKRVALFYCAESQVCQDSANVAADYAPKEGLSVGLSQAVSVAQPNFTAACLQAQGANVDAIILFVDAATEKRVSNDCAAQGYHPTFAGLGDNSLAASPNLVGMVTASDSFAWTDSSTPATATYQRAMDTYGPNVEKNSVGAGTWAAAEAFRAALSGATGSISSQSVLDGLWRMKNVTLGGLVPGMTFTQGKTAAKPMCFLPVQLVNKTWVGAPQRLCVKP